VGLVLGALQVSARLLASANGASVYHSPWRDLVPVVEAAGGCDALIVDAPYSERTHSGHGTLERWGTSTPPAYDGGARREIDYKFWTEADVREFVEAWSPLVRGWIVSITDDGLSQTWRSEFARVGRMDFASVPFVAPGSRVRLSGDGPSCWTTHCMASRPRTREMSRWGTLPGAYVLPEGCSERMPVVGGKPTWLTRALVRDYSRPGDLVVDPCCGGGSTCVGAIREGRRAIGGDLDEKHAQLAANWISEPFAKSPAQAARQPSLWGAL
jgi:site-specific DNA-methyltransferase (adenine-specific)